MHVRVCVEFSVYNYLKYSYLIDFLVARRLYFMKIIPLTNFDDNIAFN